MAERGLEKATDHGLGWIAGDVAAIEPADPDAQDPAHGLEHAERVRAHPLLAGIPTGEDGLARLFRPLLPHSLRAATRTLVARADYGGPVTAIVGRDNMAGTQFHPKRARPSASR